MSGASIVMPDRFLQADPLARMIESERVTSAGAVPTIWLDLLHHLDAQAEAGTPVDVSSLERAIVGGSACPPQLMRDFETRHGVRVLHAWGMT
jgi:fatty-acyl-CoA synthase